MVRLDAECRVEIGDRAIILLKLDQGQAAIAEIVGIVRRQPDRLAVRGDGLLMLFP